MPEGGISDEELMKRLGAVYSDAFVAEVREELHEAPQDRKRSAGRGDPPSFHLMGSQGPGKTYKVSISWSDFPHDGVWCWRQGCLRD